jgi:hypothetical protein
MSNYVDVTKWQEFKFHIKYMRSGVARIWIGDRKTKYYVNGYGYCKESSVIANMINELIGKQPYDENIYGNHKGYLSGGVGFDYIKKSFESLPECKLDKLYSGVDFDVYHIKFSDEVMNDV